MCGLVGLFSSKNKPVGQQVINLYKKQKHRGKQGYGYVSIDKDWQLIGVERSKDEETIVRKLNKDKGSIIMFHHRFPTSTENTIGTTHPMFVSNDELEFDYYVSHNGVITNKVSLKDKHEELGYEYTTEFVERTIAVHSNGREELLSLKSGQFNDSESLAIELARYLEDKSDIVGTYGTVAFWIVKIEKGTNNVVSIFFGHNHGRELGFTRGKKYFGFSSETGKELEHMKIFSYDKGDSQLYEQELVMTDDSKPRPVVPPRTTSLPATSSYNVMGEQERENMRQAYSKLENKYYTFSQAKATDVPVTAFNTVIIDSIMYYVPKKYAPYASSLRAPQQNKIGFSNDKDDEEDYTDGREKAMRRLEELASKYAQLKTKSDKLDANYAGGFLTEVELDNKQTEIEANLDAIEEEISTLGLPEEEVDEIMDLCQELEDYNGSYYSYELERR